MNDARVGALCGDHADELTRVGDITASQIFRGSFDSAVRGSATPPLGWLVDAWGRGHALGQTAIIGRSPERSSLTIMHHSVSGVHARISDRRGQLHLVDQGSLNGTYVDDVRVREAFVRPSDCLRFGEVAFYLVTRPPAAQHWAGDVGGTVPSRASSLSLAVHLHKAGHAIELRQRAGGGLLRAGASSIDLAQLEMAVLQALVLRALETDDPEGRFMTTPELVRAIDFRSFEPTSENLRELIRRVRRKLEQVGVDDLLESRRGAGYRVAWQVEMCDDPGESPQRR